MHAFRSILLAITKQHTSDMALQQAFRLVKDNRASLLIVLFDNSLEVMHRFQFLPWEQKLEDKLRVQMEEDLEALKEKAWDEGIKANTLIVSGRPRQTIQQVAKEHDIDLVVKLADPSGVLARNQLTGNDLALLRRCPVPVLMMADRNQLTHFTGKILVAVDVGSPDENAGSLNKKLTQYGLYVAAQEEAELHLVSVWGLPANPRALQTLSDEELYELQEITRHRYQHKLDELTQTLGLDGQDKPVPVHTHLLKGQPAIEIQRLANDIDVDLIVMGTLGNHTQGLLVGNTAENILNGVYCSILAVKPEGFTDPLAVK